MVAAFRLRTTARRAVVVGLLVAVGAVLAVAAWDVLHIRADLRAGQRALDGLTLDAAADPGIAHAATQASDRFAAAAARAQDSRALSLLGHLPFLDRQVAAAQELTAIAAQLGRAGAGAAGRLDGRIRAGLGASERVELLDAAVEEVDRLAGEMAAVDLPRGGRLLPPLRDARDDLADALATAAVELDDVRSILDPVRELLEGPTRLVLLGANNAEMAGGAGLTLSAGLLTVEDGEITLGDVVPAGDARLVTPVDLPDELAAAYHPTGVGLDLRSTTRSPNLPAMGPVVVDLLAQRGLTGIDGVVVVDALALELVLQVSDPVTVGGRRIDAGNVLRTVLHDSYRHFDRTGDQSARVDFQAEVAGAVLRSVAGGDVPAPDLAEALLDAGRGRNLMLWSADPELQQAWEDMGLAGALPDDGLLVSFQNFGADKLDWYLRPTMALDVRGLPGGEQRARLTMTLDVPPRRGLEGASPYILGPEPDVHGVFLTLHLPSQAYDIGTTEPTGFASRGRDGGLPVRTFLADVPLGSTLERVVEFTLPAGTTSMSLVPSARLEPVPVTVDGVATVDDGTARRITWLSALPRRDGAEPWRGVAGATVLLVGVGVALRWRRRRSGRAASGLGDGAALGA